MEQEVAVNRILRDMNLQGLISSDAIGEVRSGEARFFLNILYVVANEQGYKDGHNIIARKQTKHLDRPVIQFDRTGKRIADYPSVTEAAHELKCTRDGLYKAIKKRTPTKKGYIWVYETN